jgi:hypothetical protein
LPGQANNFRKATRPPKDAVGLMTFIQYGVRHFCNTIASQAPARLFASSARGSCWMCHVISGRVNSRSVLNDRRRNARKQLDCGRELQSDVSALVPRAELNMHSSTTTPKVLCHRTAARAHARLRRRVDRSASCCRSVIFPASECSHARCVRAFQRALEFGSLEFDVASEIRTQVTRSAFRASR